MSDITEGWGSDETLKIKISANHWTGDLVTGDLKNPLLALRTSLLMTLQKNSKKNWVDPERIDQ